MPPMKLDWDEVDSILDGAARLQVERRIAIIEVERAWRIVLTDGINEVLLCEEARDYGEHEIPVGLRFLVEGCADAWGIPWSHVTVDAHGVEHDETCQHEPVDTAEDLGYHVEAHRDGNVLHVGIDLRMPPRIDGMLDIRVVPGSPAAETLREIGRGMGKYGVQIPGAVAAARAYEEFCRQKVVEVVPDPGDGHTVPPDLGPIGIGFHDPQPWPDAMQRESLTAEELHEFIRIGTEKGPHGPRSTADLLGLCDCDPTKIVRGPVTPKTAYVCTHGNRWTVRQVENGPLEWRVEITVPSEPPANATGPGIETEPRPPSTLVTEYYHTYDGTPCTRATESAIVDTGYVCLGAPGEPPGRWVARRYDATTERVCGYCDKPRSMTAAEARCGYPSNHGRCHHGYTRPHGTDAIDRGPTCPGPNPGPEWRRTKGGWVLCTCGAPSYEGTSASLVARGYTTTYTCPHGRRYEWDGKTWVEETEGSQTQGNLPGSEHPDRLPYCLVVEYVPGGAGLALCGRRLPCTEDHTRGSETTVQGINPPCPTCTTTLETSIPTVPGRLTCPRCHRVYRRDDARLVPLHCGYQPRHTPHALTAGSSCDGEPPTTSRTPPVGESGVSTGPDGTK